MISHSDNCHDKFWLCGSSKQDLQDCACQLACNFPKVQFFLELTTLSRCIITALLCHSSCTQCTLSISAFHVLSNVSFYVHICDLSPHVLCGKFQIIIHMQTPTFLLIFITRWIQNIVIHVCLIPRAQQIFNARNLHFRERSARPPWPKGNLEN